MWPRPMHRPAGEALSTFCPKHFYIWGTGQSKIEPQVYMQRTPFHSSFNASQKLSEFYTYWPKGCVQHYVINSFLTHVASQKLQILALMCPIPECREGSMTQRISQIRQNNAVEEQSRVSSSVAKPPTSHNFLSMLCSVMRHRTGGKNQRRTRLTTGCQI